MAKHSSLCAYLCVFVFQFCWYCSGFCMDFIPFDIRFFFLSLVYLSIDSYVNIIGCHLLYKSLDCPNKKSKSTLSACPKMQHPTTRRSPPWQPFSITLISLNNGFNLIMWGCRSTSGLTRPTEDSSLSEHPTLAIIASMHGLGFYEYVRRSYNTRQCLLYIVDGLFTIICCCCTQMWIQRQAKHFTVHLIYFTFQSTAFFLW